MGHHHKHFDDDDDFDDYYNDVYVPVVITVAVLIIAKVLFWIIFCLCYYRPRRQRALAARAANGCVSRTVFASATTTTSGLPNMAPTPAPPYAAAPPPYSQVVADQGQGQTTGMTNHGFSAPAYGPPPEYKKQNI